jgi:hypothetical protein
MKNAQRSCHLGSDLNFAFHAVPSINLTAKILGIEKNAPGNPGKSQTVVSEVNLSGGAKFPGSRADFRVAVIA